MSDETTLLQSLSKLKKAGKLRYWRGTIEIPENELHAICDEIQEEHEQAIAATLGSDVKDCENLLWEFIGALDVADATDADKKPIVSNYARHIAAALENKCATLTNEATGMPFDFNKLADRLNGDKDATLGSQFNPDGLPAGLTISDDGNLLNWRGENYVRQNTLTTEQVKETIEAEIADNYIRLPCDADGVPWTLETKSFIDEAGRKGKFSGLQVDREGRWKIINVCVTHDPSLCRHIKPDSLKELLHDACTNATRIRCVQGVGTDISIEVDETELASYAGRIRELLGGYNPRKAVER